MGIFISYVLFSYSSNNYFFSYNVIIDNTNNSIGIGSISIPFIADGFLDLEYLYIILIIIIILATSNAVNLTDGLDGLSTGLTAISCLVFAVICYAGSRYDFSNYLNIIYIPNSGELFIFA